jgi:hypothetical protein
MWGSRLGTGDQEEADLLKNKVYSVSSFPDSGSGQIETQVVLKYFCHLVFAKLAF